MVEERTNLKTPEDVVIGGIYTAHPDRVGARRTDGYHQNYGQFIAFECEDGTVWMIDTYHIDGCTIYGAKDGLSREEGFVKEYVCSDEPRSTQWVFGKQYDCYYNACVQLTVSNCSEFKYWGYLPDWKRCSEREEQVYDEQDTLLDVKLWRDHCYPNGCCLVRKSAAPSIKRSLDAAIAELLNDQMKRPAMWGADFEKIQELYDSLDDYDPVKFRAAKHLFTKLSEMCAEWDKFEKDVRMLQATGDIEAFDIWERGVPASDICA